MEDDYHNLSDEYKSGGFGGSDAKKRRGVCVRSLFCYSFYTNHTVRRLHPQVDATVAIEPKRRNGEEVRTVLVPYVMHVGCTMPS